MLSPSSADLLRDVAMLLIESGECVMPRRRCVHMRRCERAEQLREASQRFAVQYGYAPNRAQLAIMAGVSKTTVTRTLGAQRKYKRQAVAVPD